MAPKGVKVAYFTLFQPLLVCFVFFVPRWVALLANEVVGAMQLLGEIMGSWSALVGDRVLVLLDVRAVAGLGFGKLNPLLAALL